MNDTYKMIVKIETLSPVIIPVTLGEANLVQTAGHLPGNVLLGMFAAEYIKHERNKGKKGPFHEDGPFFDWFLAGAVKYGHAYPCDQDYSEPYLPCPLYIHQDKGKEDDLYNILEPLELETKPLGGYVRINESSVEKAQIKKKLRFHHNRQDNRIAGRSEEGGIFNYEALEEGQYFKSLIVGPKELLEGFFNYFSNLAQSETVSFYGRVGRSRNTQYGWVNVMLDKPALATTDKLESNDCPDSKQVVNITLETPLILYNSCGFSDPGVAVFENYLQQELGSEKGAAAVAIDSALTRTEKIENFIAVWGLKKPLDRAFQAGSTFKVVFNTNEEAVITTGLKRLQLTGMGERTHEGFGRFRFDSPLTKYSYLRSQKQDRGHESEGGATQPSQPMPAQVKEAVISVTKAHVSNAVETKAVKDAKKYSGYGKNALPKNSLLGRLELIAKAINTEQSVQSDDDFSKLYSTKLQGLKKPARDQLKRCWRESDNLLDILTNAGKQRKLFEEVLNNIACNEELKTLGKMANYDYSKDQEFLEGLRKVYWLILFRRMRKLNREVS